MILLDEQPPSAEKPGSSGMSVAVRKSSAMTREPRMLLKAIRALIRPHRFETRALRFSCQARILRPP